VPKKPRRNVDPQVAHERAMKAGQARTGTDYHIRKLVDAAPPLTAEQRDRLAALLRSPGDTDAAGPA